MDYLIFLSFIIYLLQNSQIFYLCYPVIQVRKRVKIWPHLASTLPKNLHNFIGVLRACVSLIFEFFPHTYLSAILGPDMANFSKTVQI